MVELLPIEKFRGTPLRGKVRNKTVMRLNYASDYWVPATELQEETRVCSPPGALDRAGRSRCYDRERWRTAGRCSLVQRKASGVWKGGGNEPPFLAAPHPPR